MIRPFSLSSCGLLYSLLLCNFAAAQEAKSPAASKKEGQPASTQPAKVLPAKAGTKGEPPGAKGNQAAAEKGELAVAGGARTAFDKQMEEWKSLLKDLRQVRTDFQTAK